MCEICSKLIKTPERRHGVVIVNFEHISRLVLVFLLLILLILLILSLKVKEIASTLS